MKGKDFQKILKAEAAKRDVNIEDIAALLNTSRNNLYLIFKQEEVNPKFLELAEKNGINIKQTNESKIKLVPYYDVDATAGNVTIFNEDRTEYVKAHISIPAFQDCDMFISISGNSMYPKYCSGEQVALKKINDLDVVAFGEAYIIVTKEQRFLKYLKKGRDKDHWKLCSENKEEFEDFEVPVKKVLHLYIVKGKITKNII